MSDTTDPRTLVNLIALPDGATLHKEPKDRQLWYLERDGHHVRYLNEFESMFIEAALTKANEYLKQPEVYKHVMNLWVDPVSQDYVIDRCDHPPSECVPAFVRTHPQATEPAPSPVMPIDGWKVRVRGSNQELHCTGIYDGTVFVDLPEPAPSKSFDEVWSAIDWNVWRMQSIHDLVQMICREMGVQPAQTVREQLQNSEQADFDPLGAA